jgi:hypothetical protein
VIANHAIYDVVQVKQVGSEAVAASKQIARTHLTLQKSGEIECICHCIFINIGTKNVNLRFAEWNRPQPLAAASSVATSMQIVMTRVGRFLTR